MKAHVGISLLYQSERLAGAGVFARGVTRALLRRGRFRYSLFVSRHAAAQWQSEFAALSPALVVGGPDPDAVVRRALYETFWLGRRARHAKMDAVYFPHALAPSWHSPSAVTTVHDLLVHSADTDFPPHKRLYHHLLNRRLRDHVARITTVSEFCRRDLSAQLGIAPERIVLTPNALDDAFLGGAAVPSAQALHLPGPYLLSVGAAYPHKRLDVVIDVFEQVAAERGDLWLVLAGAWAGRRRAVAALHRRAGRSALAHRIRIAPRLPVVALAALYRGAEALVSASAFEGFGIPVIEAMAMGCPVAASPASAVLEVSAGHAFVASDWSAISLADAVQRAVRASADERAAAVRYVTTTYTWDRAAAGVERALEEAIDEKGGAR